MNDQKTDHWNLRARNLNKEWSNVATDQILYLIKQGLLKTDHEVQKNADEAWTPLDRVAEFCGAFGMQQLSSRAETKPIEPTEPVLNVQTVASSRFVRPHDSMIKPSNQNSALELSPKVGDGLIF